MNCIEETVIDLIVEKAAPTPQTVKQRIERRLEILREWLRDGMPVGAAIPRSLTAARLWEDKALGVEPIKSPNEFTTTHHEHGRSVRDIADLLTTLRDRYRKPKRVAPRQAQVAKFDRKAVDGALEAAVSQWHTERDRHLQEKRRAADIQTGNVMLLDENADKDRLIADLRRQLSAQTRLRVVE